jgi:hypothetical protein
MDINLREIPVIYINLPSATIKNKCMVSTLETCGFKNIIRMDGVENTKKPSAGCSTAHFHALSRIKPPFILFEDDCVAKKFIPEIEVPDDADAVYLGVSSWGRLNSHSGPYVAYEQINKNLFRIYNMLSAHAILYLSPSYTELCRKIAYHAGFIIEDYQDIGFAEIQKWFNVYAFNEPMFFQTSQYHGTFSQLTSYKMLESSSKLEPKYFLPKPIRKEM